MIGLGRRVNNRLRRLDRGSIVSLRAFQQFIEAYDIERQQQSVENKDGWQPVKDAVDNECNIAENGDAA